MANLSRGSVVRSLVWVYSAPVLGFWVMVSFIPLAGMLIEGASLTSIIGDLIFLALGFGGLFAGYLLMFAFAQPEMRTKVAGSLRGRVGLLSAYATIWLSGYWLFKYLVV
ncbi:MAG: hypothetical protein U5J99_08040 [Parvularculaceae bacterium]|nr:hypothetical protein [Parvularculaceae bacterium]